jgi:hypothetical protein
MHKLAHRLDSTSQVGFVALACTGVLLPCRFRELHERQTSTILPVATISKGISSECSASEQCASGIFQCYVYPISLVGSSQGCACLACTM